MLSKLRPERNGRHFANDIIKCIFFIENVCNLMQISPKYFSKRSKWKYVILSEAKNLEFRTNCFNIIWVRSRKGDCLVTAKPGNKTDIPMWPGPYLLKTWVFASPSYTGHWLYKIRICIISTTRTYRPNDKLLKKLKISNWDWHTHTEFLDVRGGVIEPMELLSPGVKGISCIAT